MKQTLKLIGEPNNFGCFANHLNKNEKSIAFVYICIQRILCIQNPVYFEYTQIWAFLPVYNVYISIPNIHVSSNLLYCIVLYTRNNNNNNNNNNYSIQSIHLKEGDSE